MGFEEIAYDASAAVPAAATNGKDLVKKKRANRSAKLKQCKLDARREQWLSQVKSKEGGYKVAGSPPSMRVPIPLPRGRGEEDHGEGVGGGGLQDSDLDSPVCSPVSAVSATSSRKDSPSSNSICSRSSMGSYSLSTSDAEEDAGELDDWEAVADALSADQDDDHGSESILPLNPPVESQQRSFVEAVNPLRSDPSRSVPPRAWRPDDQFRPQTLPILSKQQSFPAQLDRHRNPWGQRGILAAPSSCPICYEDLDPTDSRFHPCSCGFRLCLFCHNRILEDDGRCPGCRKKYLPVEAGINAGGSHIPVRLLRSCSITY